MRSNSLGKYGEFLARNYLEQLGYEILHTNWRHGRYGEVDLIAYAKDKCILAFVEVKTRRSYSYGSPEEAITLVKQKKLRSLAEAYVALYAHNLSFTSISFDVITIIPGKTKDQPPNITHINAAF